MGVTLVKFLDSADTDNRALYYLDEGESDLPILYEDLSIATGSIAICPKTGIKWWLNSARRWARYTVDLEGISHGAHGGTGGGGEGDTPVDGPIPKVSAVTILPTTGEFKSGTQVKLVASVKGTNLTTEDVIWSIVPSSTLDKKTTISGDGVLSIAPTQRRSKIKIQALSKDDLTTFGEAEYQIVTSGSEDPVATGLIISPKIIQQVTGKSVQFKVEFAGIGDFDKTIHWEIIGATASMIHPDGVVEIPVEEKANAFIVRAISEANPLLSDAATVRVVSSSTDLVPTGVKIEPDAVDLKLGTVLTMLGVVEGPAAISKELIWSIESPVAEGTSLSANGVLTVSKEETANEITIKAVSCQNPDVYDEVTYTITHELDDGKPEVSFVRFILNPGKIQKGSNGQLYAVAAGKNLTTDRVKYSIEGNTSSYTVISESGILAVASEEFTTSVLVTASAIDDPLKQDIAVVVIDEMGGEEKDPITGFVPEVNLVPVNTFYLRGVDTNGIPCWKSIDEFNFVTEAPKDEEGAIYVRKTVDGQNIWEKYEDGIPTMTKDEWNALLEDERPRLAHISDHWLKPNHMEILDPSGHLY